MCAPPKGCTPLWLTHVRSVARRVDRCNAQRVIGLPAVRRSALWAVTVLIAGAAVGVLAGGTVWADTTSTDSTTTETTTATTTTTRPALTTTVTSTQTAPAAPGTTNNTTNKTTHNNTTSVTVAPATSTTASGSGSGLAWWAWALIGAGAVALLAGVFSLGRRGGRQGPTPPADQRGARSGTAPSPGSGPNPGSADQ